MKDMTLDDMLTYSSQIITELSKPDIDLTYEQSHAALYFAVDLIRAAINIGYIPGSQGRFDPEQKRRTDLGYNVIYACNVLKSSERMQWFDEPPEVKKAEEIVADAWIQGLELRDGKTYPRKHFEGRYPLPEVMFTQGLPSKKYWLRLLDEIETDIKKGVFDS